MNKIYITANDLLLDSYKLAINMYDSGFRPDFIVGIWRGGTPVGIAVQEMLAYLGAKSDHIAIRTSSYTGIGEQNKTVQVHGLDYIIRNINYDDKLLLVDDVYDSGRSIQAVIETLQDKSRRNTPDDIRIATPWFKPNNNLTKRVPDYYLHSTDEWLVFPHELEDLTEEEIFANKPGLKNLLQRKK
ncbi:MAG: hypoxanthine phosphoribosyltransferase [Aquificaceae bacterium]|nr:MAG: hypoxanthine phosphoribosyltransferase [Aquificaceae bacterium]